MSQMISTRVIQRVVPYLHEDIYGYLVRVCEENRFKDANFVLSQLVQGRKALRASDLEAFAYFCRIYPEEVQCLSGSEVNLTGIGRAWQILDTYVTKANFVDGRRTKICPHCLKDGAYARGIWTLTFYLSCAIHGSRMIDRCPLCRKSIDRFRRRFEYCSCGQKLADITTEKSPAPFRLISRLLERHTLSVDDLCTLGQNIQLTGRLQALSLDGLCKTLWFIGHCLFEFDHTTSGHGRTRPALDHAERIVIQATTGLSGWPDSFGNQIRLLAQREVGPGSAALIERVLGPLQYYLYEVIQSEETAFLTATYEQYIRQVWKERGATGRTKAFSSQIELPL